MIRIFLILFLISALLLTACGQWYERRIAGVWTGAGDFALDGVDAPFTHVETLIFNENFGGFALGSGEDITYLPFSWAITDNTITLIFSNIAVGVEHRITGNTLTLGRKSDSSQFIKLSDDKFHFGGNHDSD